MKKMTSPQSRMKGRYLMPSRLDPFWMAPIIREEMVAVTRVEMSTKMKNW